MAAVSEANKRSSDSKPVATGGTYPAHNRPTVRRLLDSILRRWEIPFPGWRKKIKTQDSGVSVTSLDTFYHGNLLQLQVTVLKKTQKSNLLSVTLLIVTNYYHYWLLHLL